MSADDPEIVPPGRSVVADNAKQGMPRLFEEITPSPTGVIASALTGLEASWQARAYREIAENIRAQKDALDAETARRESAIKLLRKTGELLDIKEILALDKAERAAERAAKYASFTAKYEKIEDDRDERAHQRELMKLRRKRELQEAERDLVEAERRVFNSEQGLENQRRLKQLNLEIWEKRAATEHMDAEKVRLLLNRDIDGIKDNPNPETGTLDELVELRESLARSAHEAAASGDVSKADKFLRLAQELDDLVVATMQAGAKKEGPG